MAEDRLIRVLKICIVIGLCLFLLGHYFLSYLHLPEKMGVAGMVISAICFAFGLIFSLPTKMYLTFLLVTRENRAVQKNEAKREKTLIQSKLK
ncbi:MAG: hypothetical protein MK214_12770 [Thalassotalea sp.]|nr:hypothetical protein [Thalassotalea sp.]